MDLSIIIVNYNTFDLTKNTLLSILKYNYPFTVEIIVLDNNSTDNSLQNLKNYFEETPIKFLKANENRGFASGNNIAIKKASGRYILLLNSDTEVKEKTLENIYKYMEENSSVGATGCKVLLENGELDKACKRSFPNPKNSFQRLFHIKTKNNDYNLDHLDDNGIYEIDCLTGAFMLIRREALNDSGLLDETFFMYGEDIDLCYRIKEKGWKIVYYGKSEIVHYKGGSSKRRNFKLVYEFYRAMYIYYRKHQWNNNSIFLNLAVVLGISLLCFLKLFLNLFKRKN